MTIEQRPFGRTGLTIPAVTLGAGAVGGLVINGSEEERNAVLDTAMENGVDWIDTAALYGAGKSEEMLGLWLKGVAPANRPRISTKLSVNPAEGDVAGQARRSLEASLGRLGLDRVELVHLHNPLRAPGGRDLDRREIRLDDLLNQGGAADALDALREAGLCDWIGITALGDPGAITPAVESGRFDTAQVYYNMLNPTADRQGDLGWNTTDFDGLLHRCAEQEMGVMGIRVFAAGHLATTARHGRESPMTTNVGVEAEEARARAVFEALGIDEADWAATALRFGLGSPLLSTIVVGIGANWHFDRVLEAAEAGPLAPETVALLARIRAEHPAFRDS